MRAKVAAQFAVGAMAQKAKARCEDLISARDHSLKELADMGHPYAKRDPQNPHDPPETVHVQDGALISGLRATKPTGSSGGVSAKVVNDDPVDVWVQGGTRTMIARPYMERVRREFGADIIAAGEAEFARHPLGGQQGGRRSA